MNKDEIELDILRKEYEFTVKSIDDCYKSRYSLLPTAFGIFTIAASLILGLYNKESQSSLIQVINKNWIFLSLFLFMAIIILMYYLFKNRQYLTMKTAYKDYLENQINQFLDKPILVWDSSVLKKLDLVPYSIGPIDIITIGFSAGCLWFAVLKNTFEGLSDAYVIISTTIFLVIWGFFCWFNFIFRLTKRINKALYSRHIN